MAMVVAIVVLVVAYVVGEAWEWLADRRIEREWARIQAEHVATLEQDILAGVRHDAAGVDTVCRGYEILLARTIARLDGWQWRITLDAIQSRARRYASRGANTPTLDAIDDILK